MTDTEISPLRAGDTPQVLSLIRALATHHGDTPAINAEALQHDALGTKPWLTILVAKRGGICLGYAALCPLAQLQYGVRGMDIHHLFVREDARGRGVGRGLIEACKTQAQDLGARYLTVGTDTANGPAQALYAHLGFDPLPPPGPRFRTRL